MVAFVDLEGFEVCSTGWFGSFTSVLKFCSAGVGAAAVAIAAGDSGLTNSSFNVETSSAVLSDVVVVGTVVEAEEEDVVKGVGAAAVVAAGPHVMQVPLVSQADVGQR